jgi:hypothetical protein
LILRDGAVPETGLRIGETDLFEKLLQGKGDFLLGEKAVGRPEYIRASGGEALERHADASPGDFFGEFLDGKTNARGAVVRPGLEKMGGYAGQDISEAKDDLLILFLRFRSGFRLKGGSHCARHHSQKREKSEEISDPLK